MMSPDLNVSVNPQSPTTGLPLLLEHLNERLDRILFVLEHLPDINLLERKIDRIMDDTAKLRSSLVPYIVPDPPGGQAQGTFPHNREGEALK